jgi:hypothetical protein
MNTEKTLVRFYENSYQYSVKEICMEGSYTDLFDGISNEFNKLSAYRDRGVGGLWAEVVYQTETMMVNMFRISQLTPKMVEVVELTKGCGFEPIENLYEAERWKHVITSPKELKVLALS